MATKSGPQGITISGFRWLRRSLDARLGVGYMICLFSRVSRYRSSGASLNTVAGELMTSEQVKVRLIRLG